MTQPLRNRSLEDEIGQYVREVRTVQRNVTSVQIIDGYDPHVKVRVKDRKQLHAVGDALGEIADAPVATTGVHAPNGYRQPPAHTFYRDDRADDAADERPTAEQRRRLRAARGE
ncbi:MAG: hypothetical protein AB7O57_08370 [Hyphomicrobiaceae bacterium]